MTRSDDRAIKMLSIDKHDAIASAFDGVVGRTRVAADESVTLTNLLLKRRLTRKAG
ncbi:MAG: hypothetical protein ACAF41_31725 [Leptolyngbya sp. BL-A-14]